MKKFFVVAILFLILISGMGNSQTFTLLDYFDGDYTAYTENYVNEQSVDLGFCYLNNFKVENEKIKGESMVIENFEPSSALRLLNAKVVKTEYMDDGTIVIYAYSGLIKDKVKVENQNVNLQIAYRETYSIIGWPLILGSF